jgi:hypothetical protein
MPLSYASVIKIQKRISDALIGGKLSKWEMQFIQTIDTKLETYKTDSNLSNNQHQRLFTILTKAETTTARRPHSSSSAPFSFEHHRPARHYINIRRKAAQPRRL